MRLPVADRYNLITVDYHVADEQWTLRVADNGVGRKADAPSKIGGGLGTNIVAALASSLDAVVETGTTAPGFAVAIRQQRAMPDEIPESA
jgi:two-component sensor histidine kinase